MKPIVDRIRKLLALARDKAASENEAATAMAMAQKLMLEHNIEHVDEDGDAVVIEGEWVSGFDQHWHKWAGLATDKLFSCRHVHNKAGDFKFYGKPENVEAAAMMFPFLCAEVERLYKLGLEALHMVSGRVDKATRGEFRRTFKEACAARLYQRALKMTQNAMSEERALVVIEKALSEADAMIKGQGIPTKNIAQRKSGLGTGAGKSAGDMIKLRDAVNAAKPKVLQIENKS